MNDLDQPRQTDRAGGPAQIGVTLEAIALAIADHLAGMNRSEQAAGLLSQFISNSPSGISAKSVLALARLVYRSENWGHAAELWNLLLAEEPENIEGLVKLSHCLVELNDFAAAARAGERVLERLEVPSGHEPARGIDSLLEPVYRRFFSHFESADSEKCRALISLCALPGSYAGTICGGDRASVSGLSDEQMIRRIDSAFQKWHASREYLEKEAPAAAGLPDPPKTKILLVFRQYFFGGPNTREHELTVFLRESANGRDSYLVRFAKQESG